LDVVETDMGERIIQLAGEKPSHILAPAIHMTASEISKILSSNLQPTPSAIVRHVRDDLRRYFLMADVGITGANAISADTGSIIIVTNEGNERLVTSIPRIYICVAGVEKVVSNMYEALRTVEIQVASATGQRLTSYLTIISPNAREFGEGREFHLVLVDNGRMRASGDAELRETLRCIRCSACFNVCPTYRLVGGKIFGHIYTGPIGIPWTYITAGAEAAAGFSHLCISCGLCMGECPVNIDIPYLISAVKDRAVRSGSSKPPFLAANYERILRTASRLPHLSNIILSNPSMRTLMEKILDIDHRRILPSIPSKSLRELFRRVEKPEHPVGKAVLFTDSMIMYLFPELGLEAGLMLSGLGVDVSLPPQTGSGMPLFQNGLLDLARKVANLNVDNLAPYVESDHEVVCLEPTAEYMLRRIYPKLLKTVKASKVALRTYSLSNYLIKILEVEALEPVYGRLIYHWPCHSRDLHAHPPTRLLLERLGYDVLGLDVGCCGMAGVWGVGAGFEMSRMIVGELVEAVDRIGGETVVTDSTICLLQLQQFLKNKVIHSISLLHENIRRPAS
jgi:L-lactate utilization protein LutB